MLVLQASGGWFLDMATEQSIENTPQTWDVVFRVTQDTARSTRALTVEKASPQQSSLGLVEIVGI